MSEKLPVAVYRAKEDVGIQEILNLLTSRNYTPQPLTFSHPQWTIHLYYLQVQSPVKWKDFIRPIVATTAPAIVLDRLPTEHIVLLLENAATNSTYIVTAGSGYFSMTDFIDPDFGISVLSRIISRDAKVIKSTKEASVVGGIFGEIKFFRQNFNIHENESFGSFYQELITLIDKGILQSQLGFSDDDLKRDGLCIAKSSFKITKSISAVQLITVVNGFENILSTLTPIEINNVRKLSRTVDRHLIAKLRAALAYKIYCNYRNLGRYFNFDLCHSEFEKYLTADSYVVMKGATQYSTDTISNLTDIKQVFELLLNRDGEIVSFREFIDRYKDLRIESYDTNSALLTKDKLIYHVIGDIEYGAARYFYVDDSWYLVHPKYIDDLNATCSHFIAGSYHNHTLIDWGGAKITENQYNSKYLGQASTIVMDKVLCEHIEVCDFMRWDDTTLYLYHAKIGFGNTMRDLCSQIFISAQRLMRDLSSNRAYVSDLYDSLRAKIGGDVYFDTIGKQTDTLSRVDFVALFTKKIVLVLLVHDDAAGGRSIRNIELYNSNIAKISIVELFKKMKGIDMPLEIVQV
jgi:uncharacterized protein (TIGR04141 family)